MMVKIDIAAVDEVSLVPIIGHAGVELAREHHGADAFLRRNLVDGDSGWRLEADRSGMAARRHPFHEEGHVLWRDAELALQDAAGPQRRSLDVFRHADALASEIGRTGDLGVLTHEDAGMVEAPRREHRDADKPVIAA